ncbi:MAG: S8 family serine peptidase [Psychroflexus sp.]
MKKITFYLTFLFGLFLSTYSGYCDEMPYYYYYDEKVDLDINTSKLHISVTDDFDKNFLKSNVLIDEYSDLLKDKDEVNGEFEFSTNLTLKDGITTREYEQLITSLENQADVITISPFYFNSKGEEIGVTSFFHVKLNDVNDFQTLDSLANQFNVNIIKQDLFMDKWYVLKASPNSAHNPLELAVKFYETGLFDTTFPDVLVKIDYHTNNLSDCATDPEFENQSNLYSDEYEDINVCEAWEITEGENVNIGVLDSGIDLNHIDLADNIIDSWDAVSQTSPSVIEMGNQMSKHGTNMAGLIGAVKDNDTHIAGVAPNSNLISISMKMADVSISDLENIASGINWASNNNVDVLNNSWALPITSPHISDAIENALENGRNGKGMVMVFASGNNGIINEVKYPASIPEVLAVGNSDGNGNRYMSSVYGEMLDVIAPGTSIITTSLNDETIEYGDGGTSSAAAHVSGIAGLMLSVNPDLTAAEVKEIIEKTARKTGEDVYEEVEGRPNGTWHETKGYGFVDAGEAVKLAECLSNPETGVGLVIRDNPEDTGEEPNESTDVFWNSEDLWLRNQDDGTEVHQNPEYSPNEESTFYVKITNYGCVASTEGEVKLYWAKAATNLGWPERWDGSSTIYNQDLDEDIIIGEPIETISIPSIEPGEEVVLNTQWQIPDPNDYEAINNQPWHFCILARIVSDEDPITYEEVNNQITNTQNNNNIAWKNLTVVDVHPDSEFNHGGVVAVSNPREAVGFYDLDFYTDTDRSTGLLTSEAEVSVVLDDIIFEAWDNGGRQGTDFRLIENERRIVSTSENFEIKNLKLLPDEIGTIYVGFNFLTSEATGNNTFYYHAIQKNQNSEVIGGETYLVNEYERPLFFAETNGNEESLQNEEVTLQASDIGEPATYNWYNQEGDLIHTGSELTLSAAMTEEYKLEIIADADGYKDYEELELVVSPYEITSLSPNPAQSFVDINYTASNADSAYLMIVNNVTGSSNNHIIDTENNLISIDISTYNSGFYTIVLVCDGENVDTKTLHKQ